MPFQIGAFFGTQCRCIHYFLNQTIPASYHFWLEKELPKSQYIPVSLTLMCGPYYLVAFVADSNKI